MSQPLDKKQLIHIASEVVVLVCLTFYFNQKNKKLMTHIEDLAQRLEEQEDLLQKHEQIIRKLCDHLGAGQQGTTPAKNLPQAHVQKPLEKRATHNRSKIPQPVQPVRVSFDVSKEPPVPRSPIASEIGADSGDDSEEDDELDAQLMEELQELKEDGGLENDLKKGLQ